MHCSHSLRSTLVALAALCGWTQAHAAQPALNSSTARERHSNTNRHELERAWSYDQRAYPLGYIPAGARERALKQIQQSTSLTARAAQPLIGGGPQWINFGPAPFMNAQITPVEPTSGRIVSIAVDPTNNAHWLVGGAMGGVWETRDTGVTWSPKTDDQASLAIGALAFAPSNPAIIYAGTGEPNYGAQDDYAGAGLLKSTDGGANWVLLAGAAFSGASFSSLLVNPTDPTLVLASVTGGGAGRGGELPPSQALPGVFKSTNAGTNWAQKLFGYSTDLKADPSNFNHQLARVAGDLAHGQCLGRLAHLDQAAAADAHRHSTLVRPYHQR